MLEKSAIVDNFLSVIRLKMSYVTPDQVARIVALIDDGRSQIYVVNSMNINQSSVSQGSN